ncbi:GGDEF domain-containing protein [Stutzerimonas stutzeri]|uniref:GGDEF domain-containing protein n=1 Tax=Stutzerimonas stutzeri TaxID=316 RepID=UPI00235123C6|nr:GGDEF domain-containing protein [Stutzerimonas stutzeri]
MVTAARALIPSCSSATSACRHRLFIGGDSEATACPAARTIRSCRSTHPRAAHVERYRGESGDVERANRRGDRFGHPVGDKTLRMVVRTCQRALRAGDVLPRLGGEELAVLMPRAPEADAMEIAERLKCSIAQGTVSSGELNVSITASLGVAQLAAGEDFAAFYNKADKALYAAKQRGRDRVVAASDVLAG